MFSPLQMHTCAPCSELPCQISPMSNTFLAALSSTWGLGSISEAKSHSPNRNRIWDSVKLNTRTHLLSVSSYIYINYLLLHVPDRIDIPTEDEAFISVKDHKDSFPSRVKCRLINPSKTTIGVISKSIFDKIHTTVREAKNSNQWLNTSSAIDWFNSITNKSNYTFFKFDIVSFYPSIMKKLLTDAFRWARSFIDISVQ